MMAYEKPKAVHLKPRSPIEPNTDWILAAAKEIHRATGQIGETVYPPSERIIAAIIAKHAETSQEA